MDVSLVEADGQLNALVERAEAGEEVVLTRSGRPVAKLVAVKRRPSREELHALFEEVRASGRANATPGPDAARSQDFLYGPDGMPD